TGARLLAQARKVRPLCRRRHRILPEQDRRDVGQVARTWSYPAPEGSPSGQPARQVKGRVVFPLSREYISRQQAISTFRTTPPGGVIWLLHRRLPLGLHQKSSTAGFKCARPLSR